MLEKKIAIVKVPEDTDQEEFLDKTQQNIIQKHIWNNKEFKKTTNWLWERHGELGCNGYMTESSNRD